MEKTFPHMDYDNGALFAELESRLAPHGFKDSTWRNDACPSLAVELDGETRIQIFVDYADPAARDNPPSLGDDSGHCVFIVETLPSGYTGRGGDSGYSFGAADLDAIETRAARMAQAPIVTRTYARLPSWDNDKPACGIAYSRGPADLPRVSDESYWIHDNGPHAPRGKRFRLHLENAEFESDELETLESRLAAWGDAESIGGAHFGGLDASALDSFLPQYVAAWGLDLDAIARADDIGGYWGHVFSGGDYFSATDAIKGADQGLALCGFGIPESETELRLDGFGAIGTGGNCRALVSDLPRGLSLYVTDSDGGGQIPETGESVSVALMTTAHGDALQEWTLPGGPDLAARVAAIVESLNPQPESPMAPDLLAREYSRELRADLRALGKSWPEMLATVAAGGGKNEHDFCDANMTMARAFESVFGREIDLESDSDLRAWNEAGAIAARALFFATDSEIEESRAM